MAYHFCTFFEGRFYFWHPMSLTDRTMVNNQVETTLKEEILA